MPKVNRFILGVTGGIASGKTTVLRMFAGSGIPTISADELAHQVVKRGQPAYRKIIATFGKEMIGADREIDRRRLGALVFAKPLQRKQLEKIIHPYVAKGLKAFIQSHKGLIALDIPLLYEAGYASWMDATLVVYASTALQIQRLRSRNHLSRHEAMQRVRAQWSLAAKVRRADFVVKNTGSPAFLRAQIRSFLKSIKNCLTSK